nr:hypothetical protein [Tanacetum cinerariifolium]
MIPIGQKNTLAEYMILFGANNHPLMLDKDMYDSLKSRMELYMQNREKRRMTLESVEHGPLIWPTIKENRVTRTKKYVELSLIVISRQLISFFKIDSGLAVPVFKQGDVPIDAINKIMSFLSTVFRSRFPTTNNQLRNSSNPRQQATIHDGSSTGSGETNFICFWDKVLLIEAQGNGKVLNKEELKFLADPGVAEGPVTQKVIIHNAVYQADDLDAYDYDCDDFSIAKAVLMANLSSYRLYVLSEDNLISNESLSAEHERYKERVKFLEERQNVDLSAREKLIVDDITWEKNAQFADFEKEINYLKLTLSKQSKEKELLTETFNVFKKESKENEAKNIDTDIALKKKVKELDTIVCKMGQPVKTVHILTKPQVFYDNNLKQALGFQNPFFLKKA